MHRVWNALNRRSILLGMALAMVAVTTIGVGGIATAVIVAERIQGSGSAINVAGSLRKQSHRMGSQVLADALNRSDSHPALRVAMVQFEASMADLSLNNAMARDPDSDYAATFRAVQATWRDRLKPLLEEEALSGADLHSLEKHNALLALIDDFVADINTMVAQLEGDTEARISHMRTILGVALVLIIIVLFVSIVLVQRSVLAPLATLVNNARHYAQGDFAPRSQVIRENELGQLARAFDTMAEELDKLYQGLEQRVREKTAALTRSNQSLELLYNAIARLHEDALAPDTYRAVLADLERLLGLTGGMACLMTRQEGRAAILASTLGPCQDQTEGDCAQCMASLAGPVQWQYRTLPGGVQLLVPLRDKDGLYGVLRLALPPERRLEPWQEQLLDALSRHVGIALGIVQRTEQERLLALQEERSVIARELHDSIAQSLSYMKIQASLLHPVLSDPAHRQEAEAILADLREGITSAYRQLRELLATFRLKMQGDFIDLLGRTAAEFSDRGGLPIHLENRLESCRLSPNQEIHVLQIIREALSNVLRHAAATQAWVCLGFDRGMLRVTVEDDGVGLTDRSAPTTELHYGLNIMRERAASLGGHLQLENRPQGGARLTLVFVAEPQPTLSKESPSSSLPKLPRP
ncbi:MAG: type IV pili methyl-accepting chemotaxis transducer N-terminal domain-containing protein [Pseudomonadota bacterium]